MPRTFFVADTHFGHSGILSPTMERPRPFGSIREHDETLLALWNAVVRREDTVFHLGDFCHKCSEEHAAAVFRRLNGRKFLVRGNHDRAAERLPWDGPVVDVLQVSVPDPSLGGNVGLWLSHYAHRAWPRDRRGDLHLYGHSHGGLPGTAASTDVGVDCFDFQPVDIVRIRERLAENAAASGG